MSIDRLNTLEKKWGISPDEPHKVENFSQLSKFIIQNTGIKPTQGIDDISNIFDATISDIVNLYNDLERDKCFTDFENKVRINRLLELVYYSRHMLVGYKRITEVMDLNKDYRDNCDTSLFKYTAISDDDHSSLQNLILYMFQYTHLHQLSRYNGSCYKQIYHNGQNTYAWKYVCDIPELIYTAVQKNVNFEQFMNVTKGGMNVRNATEFLTFCIDNQFPALKKDRHTFSFTNGIYFAKYIENDEVTDRFFTWENLKNCNVHNICAAKFFDHSFEHHDVQAEDWKDIPTPVLDQILTYQEYDEDVIDIVYAMIGRLIYEINDLDGWQVIFFFQGQAGTGKSTITLNVCKNIYDEEDVGVVSNNIQKKFGLADIVDGLMYVAPEIKRDFSMEQGEFQSIISGDKVTINIKHQKSQFINWTKPGVMAGNETPDFVDNSGSIQRRIVTLKFDKKVKDGDLTLGKKLNTEMHAIIKKCNCAYQELAKKYGKVNLWSILPQYFTNTQNMIAQATNPLMHFLSNGKLEFKTGSYIPEKVFIHEFNNHCSDNNYAKARFNPDFYIGPFSQYGIKVVKNQKRRFPVDTGKFYTGTFFENVSLVDECDDE